LTVPRDEGECDGRRYDPETDIRAMEGTFVAEDGSRRRALFAGL
jgi:hypothetical protein